MHRRIARLAASAAALLVITLAAGAIAAAVTHSDVAYFDGFQDLSGVDLTQSSGVAIDALGGLRMATNGTATAATWTSKADFTTPAAPLGPVVGMSTLDASTLAGTLRLPTAPFAFRRAVAEPVLEPVNALSVDGFSVGGMSVQRISGDGDKYYMWYAGVPEDEFVQRIYLATSTDGKAWTKEAEPVLDLGEPGSFDSRQLTKPSVIYDPLNVAAPFRMWYAAENETGGGVGYATSLDGRTWTKVGEVLPPGKPGMADSHRVMQPCVLIDNGVYFMWYTADDSNNRRVAYATSSDGLVWTRGGVVFDVGTGNYSQGAFAPAVVRTASGFHMLFTGNKIVAGSDIQSKLINADSSDGLTWSAGNIAMNPGSPTDFDGYNLSQPTLLGDPGDAAHPYKLWYVGNNPDANGNYHDRIGLAYQKSAGSVTQWVQQAGTAGLNSVLGLGAQGAAFDTMKVADLRTVAKPAAAGPGLYGFYAGTNAADFVTRIGVQQSADGGLTWTDANAHATLIDAGPVGAFDEGGVACPAPVDKGDGSGWWVYHTSLDASGAPTIGLHTVPSDLGAPVRNATPVLASGGTFDAAGQADPTVVADGSALTMFYAGKDASTGKWGICAAGATTALPAAFSSAREILAPATGSYDDQGARHPVAHRAADGSWRLFYTAIGTDGVNRIAFATAPADMSQWTRRGLVVDASPDAYDFTEAGVEPSSAGASGEAGEDLFLTGTDRFGWTRVGKVTAAGAGFVAGGSATYELDGGGVRDWRRILWTPETVPDGTTREIHVSYYPTLSGGWSDSYEVARDTDLPFLLSVQKMRWQVRMTSAAAGDSPTLEQLMVNHAPVEFPATATAVTTPIGPPDGRYLLTWGELSVSCDVPAGSGLTVAVRDDAGATVVPAQPITSTGATIPLAGIAAPGSKLVAVIGFTGDRASTAKVKNLTATYTSTTTPSQLTLSAGKTLLPYGGSTTLTGKLVSDPTPLDAENGDAIALAGQPVVISASVAGTTGYSELTTVTTGLDGSFSLPDPVKPKATTSYRATWAGATVGAVAYPPAAASVRVQVKPKVTLALTRYNRRSGKYFLYRSGRTVYAKGSMTPNHARLGDGTTAGKVTVTAYQYKSRRWVKVRSAVRTLSTASAYTWSWRPKYKGTYRWATSFAGDVDHVAAVSPFRYVKVY